jgi:hypothetical protein
MTLTDEEKEMLGCALYLFALNLNEEGSVDHAETVHALLVRLMNEGHAIVVSCDGEGE